MLTRRFYKIRDLRDVRRHDRDEATVTAAYFHRGRDVSVVAAACDLADIHETVDRLRPRLDAAGTSTVVDLYLRLEPETTVHDLAAVVDLTLATVQLPEGVQRVAVVAVAAGVREPEVHHLSWIRDDAGVFHEDVVFRGLHPMIGRRLQLWRLENFEVTRLPSAEDTHVFDCVAKRRNGSGPADERLVAVAEVRDITPLRDADGALIAMPELERVLAGCLDGIRQAMAADPRPPAPRVEPGDAVRVATGRDHARRGQRRGQAAGPHDQRPGHRAGAGAGPHRRPRHRRQRRRRVPRGLPAPARA